MVCLLLPLLTHLMLKLFCLLLSPSPVCHRMRSPFSPPLSLRHPLLLALVIGSFAWTAFGQSIQPLYRVVGRTTVQAVPTNTRARAATGRVTKLDRASLGSLATLRAGMQVNLPLNDADVVAGTVNLVQTENGWTRSGGTLASGTPGTFYLSTNGAEVSGFILCQASREAYRFETSPSGEITLREVPLNDVICASLPPMVGDRPAARANPAEAAVIPILNSRPDAPAQLYLDFDGETVTDPAWNGGQTIVAAPADVSASDIGAIFDRVKEDYWPFNVNVTTDVNRYTNALPGKRMRCIITPTDTAARGAGGVAILYSFANSGRGGLSATVPCWVFNPGVVGIAEAISHELGHTFGLHHDGQEDPTQGHIEYYAPTDHGPTGWAPIMGAGYYVTVSQWSKGEYQYANNQEDDVGIISNSSNGFGYVKDEAGGTIPTAVTLGGGPGGPNQTGVITQAGETDIYSFTTTGGSLTLKATLAPVPDLDIALTLLDPAGNVVASANPPDALPATLIATVSQGTYYLRVTDSGAGNPFLGGYSNYASLGAYTITGTVPGFGTTLRPNLAFTRPSGYSDKLVVSTVPGTTTDAPVFYATDTLYLDFTVTNGGYAPATAAFDTVVYVDDVPQGTITSTTNPLPNGQSITTLDYAVGPLSEGQHTVRLQTDTGGTIAESDETDNSYSRTITVTVPGPPTITSGTSAGGQVGYPFLFAVKATNVPSSYSAEGLPPGLGIKTSTGFITGTPTAPGTYNATVRAANGLGVATTTLTVTILPAVPTLASPGNLTGEAGAAFSYQIVASNSPTGYGASGLPPGLTVDPASGLISGTPTTPGTYLVTLTAYNAGGSAASVTLRIQIQVGAPVLTSAASAAGRVGQPFSFQLTATNAPASFAATGLPDGLGLDAASGLISGTPGTPGTFAVTVSATNANRTVTASLSLVVAAPLPVAAWGAAAQAAVPADLTDEVRAVAAGAQHSLAVRADGTVEAWGANDLGQLNVPAGLHDVVAVSAGAYHSLALQRDGTVAAWGNDAQGQTDVPAGLTNVIAIAAGTAHSLALRADGTVVGWGDDTFGQASPPVDLRDVVGIAAGTTHSLALRADGTATGWGGNGAGQLNVPTTLTGLTQVAAGDGFSVLLRTTGTLVVVGTTASGVLVLPPGLTDVTSVAAGSQHILALHRDGTVTAWGSNGQGESLPPSALRSVAALAAGGAHSLALVRGGTPLALAAMPAGGSAPLEGSATLLAYGIGTGPLAYQWSHNGVDLPGQTAAFLHLENLQPADEDGAYTFRLINPAGSVTSPGATLTLTEPLTKVTLEVTESKVIAGSGGSAVLTLVRTGDLSRELIVNYSVKGSAGNGTDYARLKGFKKIKAGKASAKVKITPLGNLGDTDKKVVKFTLLPGDGYMVATPDPVKVKILATTP